MMPEADLYLSKADACRYWPERAPLPCQQCIARLRGGEANTGDLSFLTSRQVQAFECLLKAESYLPAIPQITVPQPMEAGLFRINEPDESSLVIVSGNSRLTFEVLAAVWSRSVTPAYFLLIDCLGNTVDMAMIFKEFTAERLVGMLRKTGLEEKTRHRHMIVPGLARTLAGEFAGATGWEVEVGPVCAAELPLFLGERWIVPET
jgi:CO dehydrogenase/acetyl-CoA synthase gamma subunit (corrinoid Fe-S protein)